MILLIRRPPSAYHHAGGGGRSIDTGCKDSCSSDPAWLLLAAAELVEREQTLSHTCIVRAGDKRIPVLNH